MSELETKSANIGFNGGPGEAVPTRDANSANSKHGDGRLSTDDTSSTATGDDRGTDNTNPNHLKIVVPTSDDTVSEPVGGPVSVAWCESTLTRA
jgi:hypothetical protein